MVIVVFGSHVVVAYFGFVMFCILVYKRGRMIGVK